MVVLVVVSVEFFIPTALFSPVLHGGGPLDRCAPACPENVLQVASAPKLVEVVGKVDTYGPLVFVVAVLLVYAMRFRSASRPQRRALTAVAATSLLFLPAYFIFNFAASVLFLDQNTLDTLSWGLVVSPRLVAPRLPGRAAAVQALRYDSAADAAREAGGAAHARPMAGDGGRGARRRRAPARLPRSAGGTVP